MHIIMIALTHKQYNIHLTYISCTQYTTNHTSVSSHTHTAETVLVVSEIEVVQSELALVFSQVQQVCHGLFAYRLFSLF